MKLIFFLWIFHSTALAQSSDSFAKGIQKALDLLCEGRSKSPSGAAIARETCQRILEKRVKIAPLSELTRDDYLRIRHEFAQQYPAYKRFALDYPAFLEHSAESQFILSKYEGWMWQNRIYIKLTTKQIANPQELASTIVHEVNHVLNRSEENYYIEASGQNAEICSIHDVNAFLKVDPVKQLREEYRAFYVEYLFSDSFAIENNQKLGVHGAQRLDEHKVRVPLTTHVRGIYGIDQSQELDMELDDSMLIPTLQNWQNVRRRTNHSAAEYTCHL